MWREVPGQPEREPSAHTSLLPELQDARGRQGPGLELGWVHLHCFGDQAIVCTSIKT